MTPQLALLLGCAFVAWLFRRDMRWRKISSRALWIPGLWLAMVSSRQMGFWASIATGGVRSGDGGATSLEGNPINVVCNLTLFLAALLVLQRRRFSWWRFASANKALFCIFGYFLISALWSPFPIPTLKRLIQEFGCVLIAPIILTEKDPAESVRTVFVRVSFIVFPLSVVFIRYFPHIGRSVSGVSGTQMLCGVADHKNTLGQMVMVLGLVLIWDLLETRSDPTPSPSKPEYLARLLNLAIGLYLLIMCRSATALVCFVFGVMILHLGKHLARMENARQLIISAVVTVVCALILNQAFGVSEGILKMLGRDSSLTGRTDIWDKILAQDINHLIGAGFRGFWESPQGQAVYQELGTNRLLTAHNGYLEVYLYGGVLALILLGALIWSTGLNAVDKLINGDPLGSLAVLFWPILLVYNMTESAFFILGPLWFSLLLVSANTPWYDAPVEHVHAWQ